MELEKFELKVEPLKPLERWRIIKNIVIIGIAFMLQFTAYCGAANLQSSINTASGLGTASLASVYASLVFSNIFVPAAVIRWLGTKWTMFFSLLMYMPYIAAQMYPTFYTLIPAAVLVGLGAAPLWCAKCTYLSISADAHTKFSKTTAKDMLVRFLGLFFMIYQTNQIWGNLVSSLVLSSGNNTAATTNLNETMIPILCGANFLPDASEVSQLPSQPPEKIQIIAGIYLSCMAGAASLIAVGVDSINRMDSKASGCGQSGFTLLVVTLKHCTQPTQLLLIIINIFIGLHQAFFFADFTASFVSCAVGTGFIGFVMMMFGLADAIGCLVTGYFSKIFGRLPLIIFSLFVHGGIFLTMLMWRPQAGAAFILFIVWQMKVETEKAWQILKISG